MIKINDITKLYREKVEDYLKRKDEPPITNQIDMKQKKL